MSEPIEAPTTCPRCGAPLDAGQDFCLRCGTAATTRVRRAPSWRIPVFVLVLLLALGAGGVAAAFVAVSDDAQTINVTTRRITRTVTAAPTSPPPTQATTTATTATAPTAPTTGTTGATPTATTPTTAPTTSSTATAPRKTSTSRRPEAGALDPGG